MDKISVNSSTLDILFQASPIVQLTLVVLVFLSILCWGISFNKWLLLRRIHAVNELFLVQFWKSSSLDQLYSEIDAFYESPLARVFKAAKPQLTSMDNLERVIRKAMENELAKMESKLTLLATTGSTGPFIGLFGTVWGIMTSFHKIGATGNASLAVVAPGISEALIATAVGLAAAIPAVVLYNHFISKIRKEEIELNNFSADFLNLVKRNFLNQ